MRREIKSRKVVHFGHSGAEVGKSLDDEGVEVEKWDVLSSSRWERSI